MRAGGVIFAAAMAAAVAGQAVAAESSGSTMVQGLVIQGRLSHEVQGLIIRPSQVCLQPRKPPDPDVPAPRLVSSFPADGAVVKPGIVVVRLTFDLPMACAALLEPPLLTANPCPAPLVDPVISRDRRTFMTVCSVQPNGHYGLWLNSPSSPGRRWTNLAGHELASRQIYFSASGGQKVRTIHDAVAEDQFLRNVMGEEQDAAAPAEATVAERTPEAAAPPQQAVPAPAPGAVASASTTAAERTPAAVPSPAPSVAAQGSVAVASAQPSTTVVPVTVTPLVKDADLARARNFIDAYASPTAKLDRYARWAVPPCVVVSGLADEQADKVKARIEDVAESAGLKVGADGCKPNVEIEFTAQPQALVDQIVAKTPEVLGFHPGADARDEKAVTRPIQAWFMTASRGGASTLAMKNAMDVVPRLDLGSPNPGTITSARRDRAADHPPGAHAGLGDPAAPETLDAAGRASAAGCAPQASACQSVFWNVLVVVDVGKVQDQSVISLTDYVAMLALSQPRSLDGCMALASIVDLLAPAPCPGRDPPDSLTPADTAYLAALYASDPKANRTMQQSVMSQRMAGDLAKAAPAKAPSGP